MKKLICLTITLILCLFSLAGCGNKIAITEYEWQLQVAHKLNTETMESTMLAGVESWVNTDESASVVDVVLVAKDGTITITDKTNNKTYSGSYKHTDTSVKEMMYEFSIGNLQGHGVTAYTEYNNGTKTPTLPITLIDGDVQYSLHFQNK